MFSIRHGDVDIAYRVLKTRKNKNIRITVSARTGVRVSAPRGCPEAAMHALVREKAAWIAGKLREFEDQARSQRTLRYRDGDEFPLHGVPHRITVRQWHSAQARLRLEGRDFLIDLPTGLDDEEAVVRSIFEQWLRKYARWYLTRRIMLLAENFSRQPTRVTVRKQTTKWGSCSAQRSISLNALLVCLPESLSDYVLLHELAHMVELNHSRRFWALVERHCPEYRTQRRLLREAAWLLE